MPLAEAIGTPLASCVKCCGTRSVPTTLVEFSNSPADCLIEGFTNAFDCNPIEHLAEKPRHDRADSFFAGKAPGLAIKDLLVIDTACRRTVGAANVVGLDFQAGDRVGSSFFGEHEIVVAAGSRWSRWAIGSTLIMPRHTSRDWSCKPPL